MLQAFSSSHSIHAIPAKKPKEFAKVANGTAPSIFLKKGNKPVAVLL